MKYIPIGSSGIQASRIGFGCMRLAGLPKATVDAMVRRALDAGINLFDHADIYAGGECEDLFSRSVGMAPSLRQRMVLQSKCGIRKNCFDFSRDYILQSVDGILRRLRTDYLDILLLHRPDALMEPEEVAGTLQELKAAGKVLHFGVSNQTAGQLALLGKYLTQPLVVNQLQFSVAHTGLIDAGLNANMKNSQSVDHDGGVLDYCRLHDIALQCWGPLSYGYFEGTFLDNDKFADLNAVLGRIAGEKGVSKAAVAIAWILRHPAGIQPMIGFMVPEQIDDLANVAELALTREQWYELYLSVGNKLP